MNNTNQVLKSGGDANGQVLGSAGASNFAAAGSGYGQFGYGLGGDAKSSSDANVGNTGGDASDNTAISSVIINS